MDSTTDAPPRGVLDPRSGVGVYREALIPAAEDLANIVAHHWTVRWDLRAREPYVVEVLPSPSVVLVVEDGQCRVHGVLRGRFEHTLAGRGSIFGTSFRPAGFHSLSGRPVTELTDRVVAGSEIFGKDADRFAARMARVHEVDERTAIAEAFVREHRSTVTPTATMLNEIVELVMTDRDIVRVDDLVDRFGLGKRTLQKLFRDHIGVSPKWVIQRYRLHEAAQRLEDPETDPATLAAELGYADQAHFTRDFKSAVGRPPVAYRRQ
ncbi:helix-turn-helix domain-containing protein [Nocardia altamirensis]|uniref:helix-turn-helix domain-containing protein n=1 Tax=Nocardia altamirensis TaxID=472158 RepID=UPI0008407129|nr:AraC family transcriptional regulator [Nocardia altamirensis]